MSTDAIDGVDRAEHRARVTGRTRFTTDVRSPGTLDAAFTLSSEPRARIRSVDVTAALEVPGVVTVLTGADIGEQLFGRSLRDYPVLAVDEVQFVGQRVAAVAATDQASARYAADLVAVEYEPLDPIFDPEDALAPEAAVLHPHYDRYEGAHEGRQSPNVQGAEHLRVGDPETARQQCDEVHEHTFSWSRSHAAPLEPHTCLVTVGDRQVDVYSAHKEPYKLRRDMARFAGCAEDQIVVHPIAIGGDFGAKGAPFIEGACYFLARATGRPVRSAMTYFEELTSTSARHPGRMQLTTGLREGQFHLHRAETLFEGGAFVGTKPRPTHVQPVIGVAIAPYGAPHRDERSMAVYTNALPGGQVRSPGEFQATFAGESHVDMIARARDENPLAFRLEHATDPSARRVLAALHDRVKDWRVGEVDADDDLLRRGVGVAVFHRGSGAGDTTVSCRATVDGVDVHVGVPDQGAGSYDVFRHLAADTLGIPDQHVSIRPLGADPRLADGGAGSSRVTTVAGQACVAACHALLDTLAVDRVEARRRDGFWLAEVLQAQGRTVVEATGRHTVGRDEAQSRPPAYGALGLVAAVDVDTGVTRVERACLVVDAGPVFNPVGHRGQLEGGFVYGLSQAMFEDLIVEQGQVVTASLGDYKLASAADVPPLDIHLLDPDPADDPFDAVRGVGELANLGVAPALANAIDDAVGVRVRHLPITAERVWEGLRTRGEAPRADRAGAAGSPTR